MAFNFYLYRVMRRDGARKLIRAFHDWDSAVDYLTTADLQANAVSDFEVSDSRGNTLANNRLIPFRVTTLGRNGPGSGRATHTADRMSQGNSCHTLINGRNRTAGIIRSKNRPAVDVDGMPVKPNGSARKARPASETARQYHEKTSRSARRSNRRKEGV